MAAKRPVSKKGKNDEVPHEVLTPAPADAGAKTVHPGRSFSMRKAAHALLQTVWRGIARATAKVAEHSVKSSLTLISATILGLFGVLAPSKPAPKSEVQTQKYVMLVRGVRATGCHLPPGETIDRVLANKDNAAIDEISLTVSRKETHFGFEGTKSFARTGTTEKIAGFWQDRQMVVATTTAGTPVEQATYLVEYVAPLGVYIGHESAHDCVTNVDLVCPILIGPQEKVGQMRTLLDQQLTSEPRFCVIAPDARMKARAFALGG